MDLNIIYKERNPLSKKGENGKVLIIGGSKEYTGALYYSGIAALRTGVDLVTLACPERVAYSLNSLSPDLITHKLEGDFIKEEHTQEVLDLSKDFDVILLGPGLGRREETLNFVNSFLVKNSKPCVVDADAIHLANSTLLHNAIITPHRGEMKSIFEREINKKEDLRDLIREASMENVTFVLKGKEDFICDDKRCVENTTGHKSMTKGGTGDVLSGLIVGFLGLSRDLFYSAYGGAYINGLLGEELFERKGYSWLTSEMLDEIPHAINYALKSNMQKDFSQ